MAADRHDISHGAAADAVAVVAAVKQRTAGLAPLEFHRQPAAQIPCMSVLCCATADPHGIRQGVAADAHLQDMPVALPAATLAGH